MTRQVTEHVDVVTQVLDPGTRPPFEGEEETTVGEVRIDIWRRAAGPLDSLEQLFGEWVGTRPDDLSANFSRQHPGPEDDFEPFNTASLCCERVIDGRLYVHCMDISLRHRPRSDLMPELWEHFERVLRRAFWRTVSEVAR